MCARACVPVKIRNYGGFVYPRVSCSLALLPSIALSFFLLSIYPRQPLYIAAAALLKERYNIVSSFIGPECKLSEGFMSGAVGMVWKKWLDSFDETEKWRSGPS